MKKLSLILMLLASTPFIYQCSEVKFEQDKAPRVEPIFSSEASQWGELFAETLKSTAFEIKRQKINFNDRTAILNVSHNVTSGIFEQRGLITKDQQLSLSNSRMVETDLLPLKLADALDSEELTDAQKKILTNIEKARKNSNSYIEFSNRLATINNSIYTSVPEDEQGLLFSITSQMYYGLEAINNLVAQGYLPGTAENSGGITLASLMFQKAYAVDEYNETSSWWNDWGACATVIALGVGDVFAISLGISGVGTVYTATWSMARLATASLVPGWNECD